MQKIFFMAVGLVMLTTSVLPGMDRFDVLTTETVKQMLDDRAAGRIDFLLVNTLDELICNDSSIPGSVKIPWYRINELSERLGTDKSRLIVTYCMGYR